MNAPNGPAARYERAVLRLTRWRTLFAGWQLGTRPKGDPECDAVADHRELSVLLRAEVTALTGLLLTATDYGLQMDARVLPWMKGWKP